MADRDLSRYRIMASYVLIRNRIQSSVNRVHFINSIETKSDASHSVLGCRSHKSSTMQSFLSLRCGLSIYLVTVFEVDCQVAIQSQ